jgi:hypothetical protein
MPCLVVTCQNKRYYREEAVVVNPVTTTLLSRHCRSRRCRGRWNCSQSEACTPITSRCGNGYSVTPRKCSGVYASASSRRAIVGASTKPTSGSRASGATCIARWTPPARPSTFSSRPSRTRLQQSDSWPKPWVNRTLQTTPPTATAPTTTMPTKPAKVQNRPRRSNRPTITTGGFPKPLTKALAREPLLE